VLAGDVKLAADTFNNFIAVWQKFGVLPERYHYLTAQVHSTERHYPLRPELMESALYLLQARPAAPSARRPLSSLASTQVALGSHFVLHGPAPAASVPPRPRSAAVRARVAGAPRVAGPLAGRGLTGGGRAARPGDGQPARAGRGGRDGGRPERARARAGRLRGRRQRGQHGAGRRAAQLLPGGDVHVPLPDRRPVLPAGAPAPPSPRRPEAGAARGALLPERVPCGGPIPAAHACMCVFHSAKRSGMAPLDC